MFNISQFFSRITSVHVKNELVKNVVQKAVEKYTKNVIEKGNISIKSSSIILNKIPQSLRSEIFIKKEAILREVNEGQTIFIFKEIR